MAAANILGFTFETIGNRVHNKPTTKPHVSAANGGVDRNIWPASPSSMVGGVCTYTWFTSILFCWIFRCVIYKRVPRTAFRQWSGWYLLSSVFFSCSYFGVYFENTLAYTLKVQALGWVVQRPISANPGLKVNLLFCFHTF